MQSETGFPSSHQLKSYVASKSRLKLAARAVLSADAGLLVNITFSTSSATLLVFNAQTEGFVWDDVRKIVRACQRMASVPNGVEILPKISTV